MAEQIMNDNRIMVIGHIAKHEAKPGEIVEIIVRLSQDHAENLLAKGYLFVNEIGEFEFSQNVIDDLNRIVTNANKKIESLGQ